MDRFTPQSVRAVAARRGLQYLAPVATLLVAVIIQLHGSIAQAAGDTATGPEALPLRDQVRIMTSEPPASWHQDDGQADVQTTRDRAPIDRDQSGRSGNLRYGTGYESRMGAQPGRQ